MEAVLHLLHGVQPLSDDLQDHLSRILKCRPCAKKEFLLRAGHTCRTVSFIEQGLFRCFYQHENTEVCSWFMKEGDVIISVESFFRQVPAYESIQALEDSRVWYINYEELQQVYRVFPEFNFIGRVLTERYYTLSEQRLYSLRMHRSAERWQNLVQHFPELTLRVPGKYLASYLGISEAHFSVIKAKKFL